MTMRGIRSVISLRRCGLRCVLPAMLFIWTVMCGERFGMNTDLWWYEPVDGKRVITVFNPLSDEFDGYDHAVKILSLQDVLTKEVETLTPETEEEFGNDPVLIFKGDISISGDI